jgi:hypothetical protein
VSSATRFNAEPEQDNGGATARLPLLFFRCTSFFSTTGKPELKMLRPRTIIVAGLLLVVCGFFYDLFFAGIPYPDPQPAQQARWIFHKTASDRIMIAGLVATISGIVLACARWLAGKQ